MGHLKNEAPLQNNDNNDNDDSNDNNDNNGNHDDIIIDNHNNDYNNKFTKTM